jgi:hypothetical protein
MCSHHVSPRAEHSSQGVTSVYRGRDAAWRLCRQVIATLAALRKALACAGAHTAAFDRILERKGLAAAASAGKGQMAEENPAEASGLREFMAELELASRCGSSENVGSASDVWVWHQSTELDNAKSDDTRQRQQRVELARRPCAMRRTRQRRTRRRQLRRACGTG